MKGIISYIRRSLSRKLSLWIVFFAALIFNVALGFMFSQALRAVRQEAVSRATKELDNTVLRVNSILQRVEIATDNTDWLVLRHLDAPDSMFVYSRRILENNPDLNGCSIAFEPYYFPDRGQYFSAYSLNENGTILTTQEGNDRYEYFYMDWYLTAKLLDRPCWTEPFFDYNPEDIYSKEMIASYCKPMKDKDGSYIGTISADISLVWLSETITAVKPYPNSYAVMLGEGGTFFVHPDTTKLFYQTIFTETLDHPDPDRSELGHAMLRGEEGMRQLSLDGEDCYVFFKPMGDTGWSVAIVCPEDDIFNGISRLRHIVAAIVFFGLMLMLLVFSRIVGRELKPLKRLAEQTDFIARGNFDHLLPDDGRSDELGQLGHSFRDMQQSLMSYVDELKETTARKASIESELEIARNIQMAMVPKIFPPFPERNDLDMYAGLVPAKEVGGDLYDFYIREEKLFFCIGDVSGKGIPASLVMAVTRALFRTLSAHEDDPARIVSAINDSLSEGNEYSIFVTFFCGVLDLGSGLLRYCNAGHNAPFMLTDRIAPLPVEPNIPIGIIGGFNYKGQESAMKNDDAIFLYTDGITEAENSAHELFGEERTVSVLHTRRTAEDQVQSVVKAVEDFVGDAPQSDDRTLLFIHYLGGADGGRRHLVLHNDIRQIPMVAGLVEDVAGEMSLDQGLAMGLNLALEEAVTNVILYAYPEGTDGLVDIEAVMEPGSLAFIISDSGKAFDPTAAPEPDTSAPLEDRPIGGLGIHLVRTIMDSVSYERLDGKNILKMIKNI